MTEFKHFEYKVSACIHIDEAEIDNLMKIAGRQQFYLRRDAAFLEAWKMGYSNPHKLVPGEEVVTLHEVGAIDRLVESDYDRLIDTTPWIEIGRKLRDETERLNAAWMAADRFRPRAYREELSEKYGVSLEDENG